MSPLGTPRAQRGLIAVLDALGAATYSDAEIDRFLQSRELVLNKLHERAEAGKIDKARLRTFTFNDTVVIVYLAEDGELVTPRDVSQFALRLRAFMLHSLQNKILFRGAMSVGTFRSVDDATNTVMGPAVSDAAAWYDKADWIGVAATPHASLFIQALMEDDCDELKHLLVDYPVPMKQTGPLSLKAINWPKGFFVKGLAPKGHTSARAKLLSFLAAHSVPRGSESKYQNTLKFFDHVKTAQNLGEGLTLA